MENIEKIDEILSNDEFIEKILKANSSEEVKQIFKEEDIDVTDEQIENMRKALNIKIKELNTMSDDEMGQISGGENRYITFRLCCLARSWQRSYVGHLDWSRCGCYCRYD